MLTPFFFSLSFLATRVIDRRGRGDRFGVDNYFRAGKYKSMDRRTANRLTS